MLLSAVVRASPTQNSLLLYKTKPTLNTALHEQLSSESLSDTIVALKSMSRMTDPRPDIYGCSSQASHTKTAFPFLYTTTVTSEYYILVMTIKAIILYYVL